MNRIRITEYLDIDLEKETWNCNRCGHELESARENYKKGCLLSERAMEDVHPAVVDDDSYSFKPDSDYCRLIEFYCPSCGAMLENEYLPPGHPITHEIEIDVDMLKAKYATETVE